ncbi:MAG: adenylyl-sulfate kinase [Clostridia bacterium]|nr:adenylyl-sulfate kinase [Clostridia bacterium]
MHHRQDEVLNIVTVGHVDHGKSTIIGRLLADAGALPHGKIERIRENCRRNAKPFEYAFLLDALKAEQAQGITIDTARCFFRSDRRSYIIIDAPGHIEFLKNMVTGASRAEAALMVIDASHGVEENSRRHGYFLSMLGIRQVAVVVNKMDLAGYAEARYAEIRREFSAFLQQIGIDCPVFIPASGLMGDNLKFRSGRMPWYEGPTVLEQMDAFRPIDPPEKQPLRMPVQGVYKFTNAGDTRRIIAGTLDAGTLRAGDRIAFYPSGKQTGVQALESAFGPRPELFSAGEAAGFTMTEEIFITRGELVCRLDERAPQVGLRIRANLFWLGKTPFSDRRRYYFKCGTARVEMRLEKIERIVNAATLGRETRDQVEKNEVAECILRLDRPVAFDLAGECDPTSRFVVVDDYEIAGVRNIRLSGNALCSDERARLTGRAGLVVWLTGLSGSGKTTISQQAERLLLKEGLAPYILDGDRLRRGLCADLGFSDADRRENVRRVAETAELMRDAGLVVLVTLISPFRAGREEARKIAGGRFMEVYVRASLETCIARDPKQLYSKAASGGIASFTGLDSPYEPPLEPELLLDTEAMDEESCAGALVEAIKNRLKELC